ncbi:hypothetical protein AU198_05580 [Mycobacterium sp. GA-1199]|uniref:hypothetical protein n=1 Tax=Mycobacterium sp. GA-1199 TaxID=1772287 RepID=UPI0007492FDF|nr:hypothetical protein [Mycobacterium sp. GA-1199]KUI45632.1 hypothetical protein AU198_05580 [Mycobacterium sp. GA-1199]
MRHTDSREVAVVGVVLAAVLASCLILPTIGQLATLEQTWMAAAILGIPTVAVLTVTGYRHYGPARSLAVAVVVMSVALMASWVFSVHVVAAAMSGSTTTLAMGVLLYGTPALIVALLGLLALKLVPPRSSSSDRLTTSTVGNPAA